MGVIQNAIGIVRDINDRKRSHRLEDAQKNYLNDPQAAIQQMNEIDSGTAIKFDQMYKSNQANAAEQAREVAADERKRTMTGLSTMAGMLAKARDTPGADIGSMYDRLAPVFSKGLGMQPEEIMEWRQKVIDDPSIIDAIGNTAKEELRTMTPGSALVDAQGKELYRNPVTPKVLQVGRGDGGNDVITVDPATGAVVNQGGGGSGGRPAPYSGPKAVSSSAKGMRNNNPGNLEASKWTRSQPGFKSSDGRFGQFETMEQGVAALDKLVGNKFRQGMDTPAALINSWAPESENGASTGNYAAYVAGRLGIGVNDKIPANALPTVRQAIIEFENGTGKASAAPQNGPAYSTPGKPVTPTQGYRVMTEAEKRAAGVPVNRPYQISPKGQVQAINTGPAPRSPRNSGNVSPQELESKRYSTIEKLDDVISQGEDILNHPSFDQATGSVQGRLPSIFQGPKEFDDRLQSYADVVALEAIQALKALSSTGATGLGSMTEKEGSRLENSRGSLQKTSPTALRQTLRGIIQTAKIGRAYIALDARVPREALALLIKRPKLAAQFDKKYGAGAAQRALGSVK